MVSTIEIESSITPVKMSKRWRNLISKWEGDEDTGHWKVTGWNKAQETYEVIQNCNPAAIEKILDDVLQVAEALYTRLFSVYIPD